VLLFTSDTDCSVLVLRIVVFTLESLTLSRFKVFPAVRMHIVVL
jgi:hypothetical protein